MGNDLSDAESGLIHSKGKPSETRCDLNNVLSSSHDPSPADHLQDVHHGLLRRVGRPVAILHDRPRRNPPHLLRYGPFRSFSHAVVILGAAAGYVVATLCGVLGGDYFARVLSPRVISISGGVLFILFAIQILIMKDSLVCSTNTPSAH